MIAKAYCVLTSHPVAVTWNAESRTRSHELQSIVNVSGGRELLGRGHDDWRRASLALPGRISPVANKAAQILMRRITAGTTQGVAWYRAHTFAGPRSSPGGLPKWLLMLAVTFQNEKQLPRMRTSSSWTANCSEVIAKREEGVLWKCQKRPEQLKISNGLGSWPPASRGRMKN